MVVKIGLVLDRVSIRLKPSECLSGEVSPPWNRGEHRQTLKVGYLEKIRLRFAKELDVCSLFPLAANVLADELSKTAFRLLTEFRITSSFAGYDEASVAVARVEPFCRGDRRAGSAVEMNTSSQFKEWRPLRRVHGIFVLHPYERDTQIRLEYAHGADRDLISVLRPADGLPLGRGAQRQAHDRQWRERYQGGDQNASF